MKTKMRVLPVTLLVLIVAVLAGCMDSVSAPARDKRDTYRPEGVMALSRGNGHGHAKVKLSAADTVLFSSPAGAPLTIPRQGANDYTFVNVKNFFGTSSYQVGFTFRIDQLGSFVTNLPARTQTFAPSDDEMLLTSPGLPFQVIAYPNLLNYWFTDEFLNPIYDPCWVYEVRPL